MADLADHSKMSRKAVLYRMVLPNHTCPYGLRRSICCGGRATRSKTGF